MMHNITKLGPSVLKSVYTSSYICPPIANSEMTTLYLAYWYDSIDVQPRIHSPMLQFPPVHPLTHTHPLTLLQVPPFIQLQIIEQLKPNLSL